MRLLGFALQLGQLHAVAGVLLPELVVALPRRALAAVLLHLLQLGDLCGHGRLDVGLGEAAPVGRACRLRLRLRHLRLQLLVLLLQLRDGCRVPAARTSLQVRVLLPHVCHGRFQRLQLLHQLPLGGRSSRGGLLGLHLDHGSVLGEAQSREGVLVIRDLGADRAEEVGLRLQQRVLQILAEEEAVASWNRRARLQRLLRDGLGHLHEELRHFRQGQVDLLPLILQLLGLRLVGVRAHTCVLLVPCIVGFALVVRVEDVAGGLRARQVAHVEPTAQLPAWIVVGRLLHV
mmetsp:Transcript_57476/g.175041  ORF Transcript_57476/g.175041 Transcript_57476/m.175041 type:complete len:289 (+) Transcript_57476:2-868(+)